MKGLFVLGCLFLLTSCGSHGQVKIAKNTLSGVDRAETVLEKIYRTRVSVSTNRLRW